MAKFYCTIIFSILLFSAVLTALEIDYYWKDYDGKVPEDAFVAVESLDGSPEAYIGQSSIVNIGTLPGHLLPDATSLTVTAYLKNQTTSTNLKILATQHPCKLNWAKIHIGDVIALKKLDFLRIVHGGEEPGGSFPEVYIGRIMDGGSVQVGKVFQDPSDPGLELLNPPGYRFPEFEILLYVPGCN